MAQTTVICFGKSGVLTNTRLKTEIIPDVDPEQGFSAGRVIQLLGVFAHSVQSDSRLNRLVTESYDGQRYQAMEKVSWAAGGSWQGISLSAPEVRGTYVLGYERGMTGCLQSTETKTEPQDVPEEPTDEAGSSWRHPFRSVRHHLHREKKRVRDRWH